jgi:hypothetical protein
MSISTPSSSDDHDRLSPRCEGLLDDGPQSLGYRRLVGDGEVIEVRAQPTFDRIVTIGHRTIAVVSGGEEGADPGLLSFVRLDHRRQVGGLLGDEFAVLVRESARIVCGVEGDRRRREELGGVRGSSSLRDDERLAGR